MILTPWRPTWSFYVNVSATFKPRTRSDGDPDGFWRLEQILPEADFAWELSEENCNRLADELGELILRASSLVRDKAVEGRSPGAPEPLDWFRASRKG